ncbi:hypothetical protein AB0B88_15800 [Micromonospora haikouensis]|uniref:hypothetical protein n=1 Tax=Micromonospora haikouensis TaxID=686309 RepID=UPI0033C507D4
MNYLQADIDIVDRDTLLRPAAAPGEDPNEHDAIQYQVRMLRPVTAPGEDPNWRHQNKFVYARRWKRREAGAEESRSGLGKTVRCFTT